MRELMPDPHHVASTLHHVRGHELRCQWLGNFFGDFDAIETNRFMSILATQAFARNDEFPFLWLQSWIALDADTQKLAAMRDVSPQDPILVQMLHRQSPTPTPRRARDEGSLTLGERKSLARTSDPRLLERACRDQDPAVIRILVRNPKLNTLDVLKIATSRPGSAKINEELFRSNWVTNIRVRRALALTPAISFRQAMAILPSVPADGLREVASQGTLDAIVRRSAKAIGNESHSAASLRQTLKHADESVQQLSRHHA